MGCGCNKKNKTVTASGARRVAVYQVNRSDGSLIGEYDSYPQARVAAAQSPGSRIRSTTKFVQS